MNWNNVRLIAVRELRDQLRDRRTLFVIAVLPLMLYPLVGMAFLQVTQFLREHPSRIWLVTPDPLPKAIPLLEEGRIAERWCRSPHEAGLIELIHPRRLAPGVPLRKQIRQAVDTGKVDAAVLFPTEFVRQLEGLQPGDPLTTGPEIFYDRAEDRSRIAYSRIHGILEQWRSQWAQHTVPDARLSEFVHRPFAIAEADVSQKDTRRAVFWSRSLPFILLIWALTGAFYPAIDLCAGEKERGTLETLLCSPAAREEIVWGKLITVMLFSMATSLLNLACILFTGLYLAHQFGTLQGPWAALSLSPPSPGSIFWMVVVLIPISALFAALAIALAAIARSLKEGQYYLIPLMVISMPLMLLPVLPSMELNLGTSIVPITGVVLLLRSLIEGEWLVALKFSLPVAAVTVSACWLAITWAVRQFNDESVLFREGEQFGLGMWFQHLFRDRTNTPTLAHAFLCGVILLVLRFFGMLAIRPTDWNSFVFSALVVQLALIATPALLMTIMLTRSVRQTLRLELPSGKALLAALALAVTLHPVARLVKVAVVQLYPISEHTLEQLAGQNQILAQAPGLLNWILVLAVIPAICEELAFRGFILSGMRRLGHRGLAILLTSVFFGVAHGVLQQSVIATLLGLVLGLLAVQTGSLFPCIGFHFIHNSLEIWTLTMAQNPEAYPWMAYLWRDGAPGDDALYSWEVVIVSTLLSLFLLRWFARLTYHPTPEERLNHAMHQSVHAPCS